MEYIGTRVLTFTLYHLSLTFCLTLHELAPELVKVDSRKVAVL
jgi:hypothetical protein